MGQDFLGIPVRGELHSTDASGVVAVPLYLQGTNDVYTMGSEEFLEIESVAIVSAAGGDVVLFVSTDNNIDAGEVVERGTVGTNGGIVQSRREFAGVKGATPRFKAPAGVVDVTFSGHIRRTQRTSGRAIYQQSLVPGA